MFYGVPRKSEMKKLQFRTSWADVRAMIYFWPGYRVLFKDKIFDFSDKLHDTNFMLILRGAKK